MEENEGMMGKGEGRGILGMSGTSVMSEVGGKNKVHRMIIDEMKYRMAYWATDTINLGTWETASSVLAVGLTWREAIPIVSFFPSSLHKHMLYIDSPNPN